MMEKILLGNRFAYRHGPLSFWTLLNLETCELSTASAELTAAQIRTALT